MEKIKENATREFMEMIEKSWTWDRLTEKERKAFSATIDNIEHDRNASFRGTFDQRWFQLNNVYSAFLNALGYLEDPIGWREPKRVPKF